MGEKVELFSDAAIEKGNYVFDFGEVYNHAKDWLTWRGYDLEEKKYKEELKPGGRDIKIEWELTRNLDDYTQFQINVNFKLNGLNDIKAKVEGRDQKMQQGKIKIEIGAVVNLDYEKKWEESPFLKFMKSFFEKYLYVGTLKRAEGELWREGWEYHNEMKAFLDLYKYKIG